MPFVAVRAVRIGSRVDCVLSAAGRLLRNGRRRLGLAETSGHAALERHLSRGIHLVAGLVALTGWLALAGWTVAQEVDFGREIRPIFAQHCFRCHGPDTAEGGLRLHRHELALAELDSGSRAIVPGDTSLSVMLERITAEDESMRMPPEEKPLEAEQIALIRRWIESGAKWEQHWAFLPVQAPEPPPVENSAWVTNPIDAFILSRLEANGLEPAPPADKGTLVRRLYFDLTGLPPTPEEVDAFVSDSNPHAYEELVDRLLNSPSYGERWARFWLDLVRFAETNSFERDGRKPNAWKYRDYVIRSFNEGKPFDQFIREQLAGDELDEVTAETLTATGFYRLGIWDDEPADPLQAKYDELDNTLATISQVFLGLTINCARCHDHKIDPITQDDYYGMLAMLADVTPYGVRSDQTSYNQIDVSPPELTARYAELDERQRELEARRHEIEQAGIVKMSAEDQRKSEGPERRQLLRSKLRQYLETQQWTEYQELQRELAQVQRERRQLPQRETVLGLGRCEADPPPTRILLRGNPHTPGPEVQPHFPALFGSPPPEIPSPAEGARSAGRRRILADWIASPDNLLTSRVIANRIWQFHFGRGIVRSANNFGQLGTPPTHPELLDWLAQQLVRSGWRLKPIHRMILLSSTYRMSSQGNPEALAKDPANELFWRFDVRRLSAEEVRDAVLAVNGSLNRKMFGPGFYSEVSNEVLHTQSRPGDGWGESPPEERARRSVYIHVKRSLITPLLSAFDFPETDVSCEARFVTVQPSQALATLNGEFFHVQAAQFAARVEREAGSEPASQVGRALRLALGRMPHDDEIQSGVQLLEQLKNRHSLDPHSALKYYCLMVLNLNEFIYLD